MHTLIIDIIMMHCILYDEITSISTNMTHVLAIKACTNTNNLAKRKEIHSKISQKSIKENIRISNALIAFYSKLDKIDDTNTIKEIFNGIDNDKKDSISLNAIMNGYLIKHKYDGLIQIYHQYHKLNNKVLHTIALKACILNGSDLYINNGKNMTQYKPTKKKGK